MTKMSTIMKAHLELALIMIITGILFVGCSGEGGSTSSTPGRTQGGSTARFTVVENHLYTLSGNNIQVFNIEDPSDPKVWNQVDVAWNIETIFAYENYLFIGSTTGVLIYDITDRAFPEFLAESIHIRSCDPVVVENGYAYVTLRNTFRCTGELNQLDILDVRDIKTPTLIKSYPMQAPYGLGIDGSTLFICDGEAGLKIFDVTDPLEILSLEHLDQTSCFDVISGNNLLITTGDSGISQYSYTNIPITFLSKISLQSESLEGQSE